MSTPSFPLTNVEKKAKTHAILCTTGFLILLPIGVLVARWWTAHAVTQLLISGPVIFAGWTLAYQAADTLGLGHFIDTHQKIGLATLVLYVVQLLLGIFIHFLKLPSLRDRRPLQIYVHVFVGLIIFIMIAFQVHYGLYIEWDVAFGGLHKIPQSAKNAWLAFIIIYWLLYVAGMAFLPRQIKQEQGATDEWKSDHAPLKDSPRKHAEE